MRSLRDGLRPPRRQPPAVELASLRAYLDRQSRVHLAVRTNHERHTPEGIGHDDHLLLGVPDADVEPGRARALEDGIGNEIPYLGAWLDLFAMADAAAARSVGEVLWEREGAPADDLDPLDFCFTWEPFVVPVPASEAFAGLVRGVPGVVRIEARRERLWKNGREVLSTSELFLAFDERRPDDFQQIQRALRETGIATTNTRMQAGHPDGGVRTVVLYER